VQSKIIIGDVRQVLKTLPDESVGCVVTSPPYFGLRDYGKETATVWGGDAKCEHEWGEIILRRDRGTAQGSNALIEHEPRSGIGICQGNFCSKCDAWFGSLGLEPHPDLYVQHIVEICRELKRVLKKDGSMFWVLGDSYWGSWGNAYRDESKPLEERQREKNTEVIERWGMPEGRPPTSYKGGGWLQPKQKMLIPSRVAIALQNDRWILRNVLVWHKPNVMPSSVKDRFTCAYEEILFFVKGRRYFFNLDAVRVPLVESNKQRPHMGNRPHAVLGKDTLYRGKFNGFDENAEAFGSPRARTQRKLSEDEGRPKIAPHHPYRGEGWEGINPQMQEHPSGKNPGDVVQTKYANTKYGGDGTSFRGHSGYFKKDGTPIVNLAGKNPGDFLSITTKGTKDAHFAVFPPEIPEFCIKAACPENGTVLDPFAGSGTTGEVARELGRSFILIEIQPKYLDIMKRRLRLNEQLITENIVEIEAIA